MVGTEKNRVGNVSVNTYFSFVFGLVVTMIFVFVV
jgi:hypothetical protein